MSMDEGNLVVAIVMLFPLALLYRRVIPLTSPLTKDILLSITGLLLYIFCFGADSLHVVGIVLGSYVFVWIFGVSLITCLVVFFVSLSHLLYGYLTVSGVNYSITWTLIHCSAILKVIGYFIDLYDSKKCSPESFISYLAFVVFPFTSLVGPQFQYDRYKKFREATEIPSSLSYSVERTVLGVIYVTIFYSINKFTSTDFLISPTFQSYSLPVKLVFITFWSKWLVTKYCGVWCFAEAAAAITGIGKEETPRLVENNNSCDISEDSSGISSKKENLLPALVSWDGISNIHAKKFELSLKIQDELTSFNVQVHHWVKRYVYKRCKVLNNMLISRVLSLLFLYLWHGVYLGFLNLFLVEALGISCEEALNRYISRDKLVLSASSWLPEGLVRWVLVALQYLLKNMCVGYGLVGFALRSRDRCHVFYGSVYYCFHVGMLLFLLVDGVVSRKMVKRKVK